MARKPKAVPPPSVVPLPPKDKHLKEVLPNGELPTWGARIIEPVPGRRRPNAYIVRGRRDTASGLWLNPTICREDAEGRLTRLSDANAKKILEKYRPKLLPFVGL